MVAADKPVGAIHQRRKGEPKMEIGTKMQDAINHQIREELASAYIYLSMSAYLESLTLPGMAHWMKVQSQEELAHALKFFDHVVERGGRVVLEGIDTPPLEYASPAAVFDKALDHERYISNRIHELYGLALGEKEYASLGLLQWFIDEQVEEEAHVGQVVETLRRIGDKGQGLVMLDHQLAARGA
jgi:ferritin